MRTKLLPLVKRFADFLIGYPVVVVSGLVFSAFVALYLARDLKFDFTPQSIYRGNDALVAYSEQFKQTFGYDEAIVLIMLHSLADADVMSVPALQWQDDVAHELESLKRVRHVDSLATIQIPKFTVGGGLHLEPLINEQKIDESVADRVQSLLEGSQMVRSGLLSPSGHVAAIAVHLDPDARDIDSMRTVVGDLRSTLKRHPAPSGFETVVSGLPQLRVEIVDDLERDMATLMPLGGIVYLIVLGLMFRQPAGAMLPLCAVGIGLIWTLATFAVTHDSLNLVSNILPVLLMIIGVSSCVQIVTCYAEETAAGRDRISAARETIVRMVAPCLLVALTTAVGFFSLLTARSELLIHFGWQAALGIGYLYISTILTLGTLLRFFPAPRYVEQDDSRPSVITKIVTYVGGAVARRPRLAMGCALIVIGLAVLSGSQVVVDSKDLGETFRADAPSMYALRLVDHELGGLMPLDISLTSDQADTFLQPETFHQIFAVETQAKQISGVLVAQSYVDLFREIIESWPGRRRTETNEQLVPRSELGQERLQRTWEFVTRFPEAFHFDTFVTDDGKRARIRMRLKEIGSRETLAIIQSLEQILAKSFPKGGHIQFELTGEGYVNAVALTVLVRDLYYSLLTAFLVIFTLIMIEFRSLRTGLIAAIPNVTPLAITLGYMGIRGYPMNVANVIAFTICLGLADDNAIYFLYRFRQEMEACRDVVEAVRRTFLGTGRAIVLTSILLLVGMSVLLCSNFVPTQRFAELTSVTITGNLLGVLLLLPACLVLFGRKFSAFKPLIPADPPPDPNHHATPNNAA